jgi:polysaccharide export outer membrane protein
MRVIVRLIAFLALSFAACGYATAKPALVQPSADPERYSAPASQIPDYTLGVGDKIRITVFNEPTLSGEFAVGDNGSLSLPLIGDVKAVGKQSSDIAKEVQADLGNGYLRSPQVSAEVIGYRPFFIMGEVKTPGQFPYASSLTVFNAIATAQGFTPRASKKIVYIRRAGSSDEQAYRLTPDLRVLPGDTLRIGERYF